MTSSKLGVYNSLPSTPPDVVSTSPLKPQQGLPKTAECRDLSLMAVCQNSQLDDPRLLDRQITRVGSIDKQTSRSAWSEKTVDQTGHFSPYPLKSIDSQHLRATQYLGKDNRQLSGVSSVDVLPETADVVIVGAGPTGLVLACELARRDVDVLIFDINTRTHAATAPRKPVLLTSRSLEVLASLRLEGAAVARGHIIRRARVRLGNAKSRAAPLDVRFNHVGSPFPFSLAVEQTKLEELLNDKLLELGHRVQSPVAVWKIEVQNAGRVGNGYDTANGTPLWAADVHGKRNTANSMYFAAQSALFGGVPSRVRHLDSLLSTQPTIDNRPGGDMAKNLPSFYINENEEGRPLSAAHDATMLTSPSPLYGCTIEVKPLVDLAQHLTELETGGHVTSDLGGQSHQIRCRYIIGCDGAASNVRRAVEVPLEIKGPPVQVITADITVVWNPGSQLPENDRMHILQTPNAGHILSLGNFAAEEVQDRCPGGLFVAVPLSPDSLRWSCTWTRRIPLEFATFRSTGGVTRLPQPDADYLQNLLSLVFPGASVAAVTWVDALIAGSQSASRFVCSTAILAGAAAHTHPPIFSQMTVDGIQDAYNLAWKLAAVMHRGSNELLESYHVERREAAEHRAQQLIKMLDFFIPQGLATRLFFSAIAPALGNFDFFVSTQLVSILTHLDLKYAKSDMLGANNLPRGTAAEPGVRLPDASVVIVECPETLGSGAFSSLHQLIQDARHSLLLAVHVLPPGTKVRTLFGCERNEEAMRWNVSCFTKLARFAKMLSRTFRMPDMALGGKRLGTGLRVIWVVCGLVNVKDPRNTVGAGEVANHVPHRLRYFFRNGCKLPEKSAVVVDYANEVHATLGLRLGDPDSAIGAEKSGAFVFIRPDGHVCFNGYAGDAVATCAAFEYVVSRFTDI